MGGGGAGTGAGRGSRAGSAGPPLAQPPLSRSSAESFGQNYPEVTALPSEHPPAGAA